jgi:hypothetical protein
MRLLFCYSDKIGSRVIRWALQEEVSHVAVEFDSGLVVEATLTGIRLDWSTNFRSNHCIPYEFPTIMELEAEGQLVWMSNLMALFVGQKYDYAAFVYLAWRVLLLRVLGLPIPGRNKWNKKGRFMCTELATAILAEDPDPTITPMGLYTKLKSELDDHTNNINKE